jgi:hypothetical protein
MSMAGILLWSVASLPPPAQFRWLTFFGWSPRTKPIVATMRESSACRRVPVFSYTRRRCVLTVFTETLSRCAVSEMLRPEATERATRTSANVRPYAPIIHPEGIWAGWPGSQISSIAAVAPSSEMSEPSWPRTGEARRINGRPQRVRMLIHRTNVPSSTDRMRSPRRRASSEDGLVTRDLRSSEPPSWESACAAELANTTLAERSRRTTPIDNTATGRSPMTAGSCHGTGSVCCGFDRRHRRPRSQQ